MLKIIIELGFDFIVGLSSSYGLNCIDIYTSNTHKSRPTPPTTSSPHSIALGFTQLISTGFGEVCGRMDFYPRQLQIPGYPATFRDPILGEMQS